VQELPELQAHPVAAPETVSGPSDAQEIPLVATASLSLAFVPPNT
jgi:hypothetical protein